MTPVRLLLAPALLLAVAAGAAPAPASAQEGERPAGRAESADPPAAAEEGYPICRKRLRLMLGKNVLHLRGEVVDEDLIYRIWMDRDRWEGLGQDGQDGIAGMIRCSVTEGRNDRTFSLTVRSAYSNAIMARYEDDRLLPAE